MKEVDSDKKGNHPLCTSTLLTYGLPALGNSEEWAKNWREALRPKGTKEEAGGRNLA